MHPVHDEEECSYAKGQYADRVKGDICNELFGLDGGSVLRHLAVCDRLTDESPTMVRDDGNWPVIQVAVEVGNVEVIVVEGNSNASEVEGIE